MRLKSTIQMLIGCCCRLAIRNEISREYWTVPIAQLNSQHKRVKMIRFGEWIQINERNYCTLVQCALGYSTVQYSTNKHLYTMCTVILNLEDFEHAITVQQKNCGHAVSTVLRDATNRMYWARKRDQMRKKQKEICTVHCERLLFEDINILEDNLSPIS